MLTFIKYEWKYWLTSPMTWILLLVNTAFVLGASSSDSIVIGGAVGSVHQNAPYIVQQYYGIMSMVCLLMTTAYMNASAGRDFQYNMYQLIFSTPVKKSDYFFGKFIGAVTMAMIPMLGVSLGSLLAPYMWWIENPERYGAVIWSGHWLGIITYAIPNTIIAGVILYSLAMIFRSTIVSFIGAMGIIMLYSISGGFTRDIQTEWLSNILDPFGFRPSGIAAKYLTVDEKNLNGIPLSGQLLWNRLTWVGISILLLVAMYFRFSFSTRNKRSAKNKQVKKQRIEEYHPSNKLFQPSTKSTIGPAGILRLTRFELKAIINNPVFIILIIIGLILLVTGLTSFSGMYGDKQYPVTYDVVGTIRNSFFIFIIAVITFYSGVVVWRERDARINEIQDAAPVNTGAIFISKFLAMIAAIAIVEISTIVIGVIAQACYGYTRFELSLYIKYLLIIDLLKYSYYIMAALFFHYVINNRYIAYFAFVSFLIINLFIWPVLEVQTNMTNYGSTPSIIYSDMNGFGPFVLSTIWFNIYWSLFVLILGFVVFSFYVRGKEISFKWRTKRAGAILKRNGLVLGIIVVAYIVCTGFIYYNTKVINTYQSSEESEELRVSYEKKYKKYENLPQPRWYKLDYKIDLYPNERNMRVSIDAWVHNVSGKPISELYMNVPDLKDDSLYIIIPGSKIKLDDRKVSFRIVSLDKPMLPGDSMLIKVSFFGHSRGFENEVSFTQLTQNGTFFNNGDIMPSFGYNEGGEISDKNKRKKYKLPARKRMPLLNEADTTFRMNNYVINDADWVTINTTISTVKDQIAVAPGSLVKEWEADGRRYFNYKTDHESLNFYSFVSARYEVARRKWNGIDIEVYYDKKHAYNVPNMLNSIQKSLEYYTTHFGPYYHKQARIIEFPRYQSFAQAFPGTMPYSEGVGFITDLRDVKKDDIDFVFYIVAHEMGHQYWAHQLCGADMQGSEMMSEGFAQYSSLMVMEKEYGKDKMKKFLKYEMDGYLRGRSNEFEAERPLMKAEHQQYIYYQKASVVLYYLKEMIGEERMNVALHSLIDSFAYRQPPYATSMSAYRAFKAVTPDSLQYLVDDLLARITLFSNRVTDASYTKKGNEYEVKIKTISEKYYADSLGKENKVPVNDFIDIGVFAEGKDARTPGKALLMQRIRMNKGDSTFVFRVKEKPYMAGIDPYNYMIDRVPDDNLKRFN